MYRIKALYQRHTLQVFFRPGSDRYPLVLTLPLEIWDACRLGMGYPQPQGLQGKQGNYAYAGIF